MTTPVPVPDPELLRQLRPEADRAASIVARRLADAKTHAAVGNLPTASRRLAELTESLARHVADTRGHFYRAAFALHRRNGLDPAIHRTDLAPDPEGEAVVRRAEVLGRNYVADFLDIVSDADAGLESAVLAGGGDYLDAWEDEHRDRLTGRATAELSNSQMAIFEAVGQILLKPELR
jgi:hypothetical protein